MRPTLTSQFIEAYDPGNATGYVEGGFGTNVAFSPVTFQTLTPEQVYRKVSEWPQYPDRIRIVESFRLRSSNEFSARLKGVGLIEVMKYVEWQNPQMRRIIWQTRGDKKLVPDQLLKDTGLWRTGSEVDWNTGRHVNDATIHALAYLFKQEHEPTLEKYWGNKR